MKSDAFLAQALAELLDETTDDGYAVAFDGVIHRRAFRAVRTRAERLAAEAAEVEL